MDPFIDPNPKENKNINTKGFHFTNTLKKQSDNPNNEKTKAAGLDYPSHLSTILFASAKKKVLKINIRGNKG